MITFRKLGMTSLATVSVLAVGISASVMAAAPAYVSSAVASVGRPPDDMARDVNRKPVDTVAFAGVKPGDKVLELIPGRGYYTRILSKVVGPKGKIYALAFNAPGGPPRGGNGNPGASAGAPPPGAPPASGPPGAAPPAGGGPPAMLPGPGGASAPQQSPLDAVYRLSRSTEFNNVMPLLAATMAASGTVGLPEPVDVVWTSDNYHDFHNKNAGLNMAAINKSIFENLKPGGVYIVIDHAAPANAGATQTETLHRIDIESVKKEIMAAGFMLDAESDMLANAADDHTKPVFQLQGKADEFVLRFKKPATAKATAWPKESEMTTYYGNTLVLGTPEQRNRTIFYQPDHTYQEFGADGITNGIWYLDAYGNNCMYHQTERAGNEGAVACRQMDFPASKKPKLGDTFTAAQTGMMAVALMKGYVYPNVTAPQMPPGAAAAPRAENR